MSKNSNIVDAILHLEYDDTTYHLPCKANTKTHEITHIEGRDAIDEDEYGFWSAEVEIGGVRYQFTPLGKIDELAQDDCQMDPIKEFVEIQNDGNYWEALFDGEHYLTIEQCIRLYRWMDLKECLYEEGLEAIADFIGAKPGSDLYAKVMDRSVSGYELAKQVEDAEAKMPEEEFMRFFQKYDDPGSWELDD